MNKNLTKTKLMTKCIHQSFNYLIKTQFVPGATEWGGGLGNSAGALLTVVYTWS